MTIELKIEVLPLVKAFLRYKFPVEPFELYRNNQYGIFLFNALTQMAPMADRPVDTVKYCETLKLRTTERIYAKQGLFIPTQKIIDFNNAVLYNIDEDFCNWMSVCSTMVGGKLKDHMFAFREHYGLNENVFTLKCMEKKWERHRKEAIKQLSA